MDSIGPELISKFRYKFVKVIKENQEEIVELIKRLNILYLNNEGFDRLFFSLEKYVTDILTWTGEYSEYIGLYKQSRSMSKSWKDFIHVYDELRNVVVDYKDIDYNVDNVKSLQKIKFVKSVEHIYNELDREYRSVVPNFDYEYFTFFNMDNHLLTVYLDNGLTQENFEKYRINTDEENDMLYDFFKQNFFKSGSWLPYYRSNELKAFLEKNRIKKFLGWNVKELKRVILDSGLLDTEKRTFIHYDCYKFPQLNNLGFNNPNPLIHDTNNRTYIETYIDRMPKYFLEMLYTKFLHKK